MAKRELPHPPAIEGDEGAREMIRVWIAHEDLHLSLNLGMYADNPDWEIDERDAWGELLSDVIKHIANGLEKSHGWEKPATASRIRDALLAHLRRKTGVVEGDYWTE